MSELRVNKIVPRNGIPVNADGGGIIQCVQTVTTEGVTFTNTSFADIPSPATMEVAITPSSSSNKVLIIADISTGGSSSSYTFLGLVRGSTELYRGTESKTYVGSKVWYPRSDANNDGYSLGNTNIVYLDSPSTTSTVTYKIQCKVLSGTGAVNRRALTDDTCMASSLIAMEVSG